MPGTVGLRFVASGQYWTTVNRSVLELLSLPWFFDLAARWVLPTMTILASIHVGTLCICSVGVILYPQAVL